MVEQRTTRSFASKFLILAGATALLAFTSAGCAAGVVGDEADLDQAPALESQTVPDECAPGQYGHFSCSNPVDFFDYSAPGCGFSKKPFVQATCEAACNVPCIDSGWGG